MVKLAFWKKDGTTAPKTPTPVKVNDYHPYKNDPSKAQVLFEILCYFALIAVVPCWLGGVFGIWTVLFGIPLALMGLFSWTRRHVMLWILADILFIIWVILAIILYASKAARCVPFASIDIHPNIASNTDRNQSKYCGSGTALYITHGILLAFIISALLVALKLVTESRHMNSKGHSRAVVAPPAPTLGSVGTIDQVQTQYGPGGQPIGQIHTHTHTYS